MPFVTNGGVRLFWDQRGRGVPILLIMGHRYGSDMWYPVFDAVADRRHLIWFDNQGVGQSGARAKTSVEEMTEDALKVLDAAGVESAHIYGVSMGGGIALEFGRRYPERTRSLILGCTRAKTPDVPEAGPKWLMALLYRISPLLIPFMSGKIRRAYGRAAPEEIDRDLAILAKTPFSMTGVLAQGFAIMDYSIDPEDVEAIQIPALVLHSTHDQVVPYEAGKALSERLPNARLVTFEGLGHNYMVGGAERANAEVERFIDEVELAR